jgi:hypothetical protein
MPGEYWATVGFFRHPPHSNGHAGPQRVFQLSYGAVAVSVRRLTAWHFDFLRAILHITKAAYFRAVDRRWAKWGALNPGSILTGANWQSVVLILSE